MLTSIKYKEAGQNDIENIFNLIKSCFDEFVAVDYHKNGVDEFYKYVNPDNLSVLVREGSYTNLAFYGDRIVGLILFKEHRHISLFFVDREFQGKGIGKTLFKNALSKIHPTDHTIKVITVNSSLIAVKIYEKLGFRKTMFEQNINGIRFIPMVFNL